MIVLPYEPQEKQRLLHGAKAKQVFYGGAAGGGKSHSLRWDAIAFCLNNPGCDAYLFRRSRGELMDNHIRKIKGEIPKELGDYNSKEDRFNFYNGSGINFCYCEKENDVYRYQGAEIHWLGVDEATHLTDFQLSYLRGRVRLGSWKPEGDSDRLPRIVFCSNPGGPGHQFLKDTFISPAPAMRYFWDATMKDPGDDADKGWLSVYIPAGMDDNRYLDPNYAGQFASLPPEMARALTEGDWDAVVGAALHNLSRERHLVRDFDIPRHWTRFMVIDWGTAKPFSVGWYAVSDGALVEARGDYGAVYIPSGALVRYREWYGWDGKPNRGSRLPATAVAKRLKEMEDGVMDYRVGDTGMWAQHDGPSVYEKFYNEGIFLRQSKKDRIAGYWEILSRLAGNEHYREDGEEDHPMLFITESCKHFWRTCPVLVADGTDPEKGPDTKLEDHCLTPETLVQTNRGPRRIDDMRGVERVLTPVGYCPFIDLGVTAKNQAIWRLDLEDGQVIEGTGSHPVLCTDGEYRRLDELSYSDYVVSVERDDEWHNTFRGSHTGNAATTGSARESGCTAWYGSIITAPFRKAITSTIAITTETITRLKTWRCFQPRTIFATTPTNPNISNMPSGTWKRAAGS